MAAPRRRSILLIDPFRDERNLYATWLRARGFQVQASSAANGRWRQLLRVRRDAIVVRGRPMFEDVDGMIAIRLVRGSRHDAPVILLTTDAFRNHDEVLLAGCSSVLLLPVMPDALIDAIERVIEAHRHRAPAARGRAFGHRT